MQYNLIVQDQNRFVDILKMANFKEALLRIVASIKTGDRPPDYNDDILAKFNAAACAVGLELYGKEVLEDARLVGELCFITILHISFPASTD